MTSVYLNPSIQINIPEIFGQYRFLQIIGQGSSSIVIKIQNIKTEKVFACKVISQKFLIEKRIVKRFQHEVEIFSKLVHPNIVKLEEMISDEFLIYIVMEYCSGGDLHLFISERGKIEEKYASKLFRQILYAVNYLHRCKICHRDLKPENILLDENMNIKLADFGFSNEIPMDNSLMETKCGSPIYTAPEIISFSKYDGKKADMWSCGVILFVILTGSIPWENAANSNQLFYQIQTARYHIPPNIVPKMPSNLINGLMQPLPEMRFTSDEALSHPWIICRDDSIYHSSASGNSSTLQLSKLCKYSSYAPNSKPIMMTNSGQDSAKSLKGVRKITCLSRKNIMMKYKMPPNDRNINM